jgi:FtsZ-interacting cell division protein ZipA
MDVLNLLLVALGALVMAGLLVGGWWASAHASHENQTTDPFGLAKASDDRHKRPR